MNRLWLPAILALGLTLGLFAWMVGVNNEHRVTEEGYRP